MRYFVFVICGFLLGACAPELPNAVDVTPVTAVPTEANELMCEQAQDKMISWDERIDALTRLSNRNVDCSLDIELLLYITYVAYGQSLEDDNKITDAIDAYDTALEYFAEGTQALARLEALQGATQIPEIESCTGANESIELEDYRPVEGNFATITPDGFQVAGGSYPVYGVTYYPSQTPFEAFLTETDLADIADEFEIIQAAGINTLKIFLRPDDLFICDAVVPNPDTFALLDGLIQRANDSGFRLIVVLNQDVAPETLYFEDYVIAQMVYIVERYRDEPTVLAWDLRDAADDDYGDEFVRQDIALRWFADVIIRMRTVDSNHAITIGMRDDALLVAPFVDFVSFQFFGDYEDLRQQIANLRASANRPILLTSTGYSTFTVSDVTQRNLLFQIFEEIDNNNLMGWVTNHAFDYPRTATCIPPDCPGDGGEINQFGLWNTGYFPKLAVEAIRIATGLDE